MIRSIATGLTTLTILTFAVISTAMAGGGAEKTSVLKSELQGMEGTEANIVRFSVEPGWKTARHMHPGHVFVYVTKGAIVIEMDGKEPHTVSAGEAIYELPETAMIGRTANATEGAEFLVFQIGPTGKPLMVAQPE